MMKFNVPYQKFDDLRKKTKKSITKIALEMNINAAILYSWKEHKTIPKIVTLALIAEYFGVPIDYFIEKEQEEK